jgi:hypothetical protein
VPLSTATPAALPFPVALKRSSTSKLKASCTMPVAAVMATVLIVLPEVVSLIPAHNPKLFTATDLSRQGRSRKPGERPFIPKTKSHPGYDNKFAHSPKRREVS